MYFSPLPFTADITSYADDVIGNGRNITYSPLFTHPMRGAVWKCVFVQMSDRWWGWRVGGGDQALSITAPMCLYVCVCMQPLHQSELSSDCQADCPLRPSGPGGLGVCNSRACMRVCERQGERARPEGRIRKWRCNAHIHTFPLIYNCSWK